VRLSLIQVVALMLACEMGPHRPKRALRAHHLDRLAEATSVDTERTARQRTVRFYANRIRANSGVGGAV